MHLKKEYTVTVERHDLRVIYQDLLSSKDQTLQTGADPKPSASAQTALYNVVNRAFQWGRELGRREVNK